MIRPRSTVLSCGILFLLSQAAVALDCGKARSPVDMAICATPAAKAADEAMGKAYEARAAALAPAERAMLVMSQRKWLALRVDICTDDNDAKMGICLAERTRQRERFLLGLSDTGPGPAVPLTPVFVQAPKRKSFYALDVDVLKVGTPTTPGETLFNRKVDAILKDVPSPQKRDESDMELDYDVALRLVFASPDMLSAQYLTYDFSGGAHGNSLTRNINIDLRAGRPMRFEALFVPAALAKLRDACLAQIRIAKADRMPDEVFDAKAATPTVEANLKDFEHWSLTPGKADVSFDEYDLGAYAEGQYTCSFEAAVLAPLLKPDAHLP